MCRRIFKEQTSETGDIPFYKIGTFGADPDAFISRELFEEYKSKYPYPQKGDILISASGSIGRTVEFAGNNEYFQDSNIVWLNHDERLSNPFLKCFYSVVKWAGIEGSTIKRLYNDNILNTVICMPSVPEQKRIGLFFENLDNLITLHQRQLFLHSTPDISLSVRLIHPFYTSSWEQRKLGDIASDMVAGGDIDKDLILAEGQYPVIANALTGDGIVGYYDKEYRVNAPAVTVTGRGDVGHAKARLVNFTPVVRLLSVKSEHDVFFLENAINTLKIVIESTGVPQLTVPQLAKYEVAFPRQLDEEEHIGAFFKQLDHLITLHQRKGKAAVSGCFLNCFSLEKSSAQSRTLELFGQISNQEIKYIIDGLSILGGKLRNFCVKLIILLSYTRINDIAKYHISRNTECVHNIN